MQASEQRPGTIMDCATLFIARSRHYLLVENRTKLHAAVRALPADALWWRANDASNSVGNLLMHLAGNIRQWIVGGVGGESVERDRAGEFSARDGASAEVLLAELDAVLNDVDRVLSRLSEADLSAARTIQGRDVTVLEALYHVVEHFALHLGQVVLIAKIHAPGTVRFYEDVGGLARPVWATLGVPPRQ
jgi:uncharacterized damage-inducible protein DinB